MPLVPMVQSKRSCPKMLSRIFADACTLPTIGRRTMRDGTRFMNTKRGSAREHSKTSRKFGVLDDGYNRQWQAMVKFGRWMTADESRISGWSPSPAIVWCSHLLGAKLPTMVCCVFWRCLLFVFINLVPSLIVLLPIVGKVQASAKIIESSRVTHRL